ncbi:MAG: zinc ribbon-containing protein [Gammaproteobacteria bacterium]|jgi:hypothetical protein|nr:zinc ribbon-containing protein [Gammaproteobacteria bacterium]
MIQFQKKPANHLITAYNQMMQEMRNAFEHNDPRDMSLQKALDFAKHQVVRPGEVTAEEADEIGEYIKRDINDAAEYMMDASAEFYDWLMLDIEIIERKVMDLFLSVADNTRVELEHFRPQKRHARHAKTDQSEGDCASIYRSGEITGPGCLICECCGKARAYLSSDEITDCGDCGHHRFIRRQQGNS